MMRKIFTLLAVAFLAADALAQEPVYVPSAENLKAREEFQDNKFGIFIHWGLYSMIGQGEWYMNYDVNWKEYEKYASAFYPANFNAEQWVSATKASGARYITITSRHHDGFSMFDTEWCDYDIVDATPFGRDVLKELADECHRQGIRIHFYYSHADWRRPDYPRGRTGHDTGREEGLENWDTYYEFMNNQLRELLTNYGEVGAIWFDGVWDHDIHPDFDWHLDEQYAMIHELQPACLIGNNHHMDVNPGEDIQIFERDKPGENYAGYSEQAISALPLETCQTMNGSWGYRIKDQNYKSVEELIHYLVTTAGRNGNLLLNVGPQPNGELPAAALERLAAMGQWLDVYGETIYGTRGGDVAPHPWGVSTRKGDKLYIHILDLHDNGLYIPLKSKVVNAVEFVGKAKVGFKQDKDGVLLKFDNVPQDIDYVVELTLR